MKLGCQPLEEIWLLCESQRLVTEVCSWKKREVGADKYIGVVAEVQEVPV